MRWKSILPLLLFLLLKLLLFWLLLLLFCDCLLSSRTELWAEWLWIWAGFSIECRADTKLLLLGFFARSKCFFFSSYSFYWLILIKKLFERTILGLYCFSFQLTSLGTFLDFTSLIFASKNLLDFFFWGETVFNFGKDLRVDWLLDEKIVFPIYGIGWI